MHNRSAALPMDFTSNITQARFKNHSFYLKAGAMEKLKTGDVTVHGGDDFMHGEISKVNSGPQGLLKCSILFQQSSLNHTPLPLQQGDVLKFEVKGRAVHLLSLKRNGEKLDFKSSTKEKVTAIQSSPDRHQHKSAASGENGFLPKSPSLPLLLRGHAKSISNLGDQNLPEWNACYNNSQEQVMKRLYQTFPDRKISREQLIELYRNRNDPTLALVATMVWGHIDAYSRGRLQRLIIALKDKITPADIVNLVRNSIRDHGLDETFCACSRGGPLKIAEVDFSYFTKIFFFIGQAELTQLHPLIFDRWTINAFFVLANQSCPKFNWLGLFRPTRRGSEVILRSNIKSRATIYSLYVDWMNQWAKELLVTPAKLEQFIFGAHRGRDRSPDNLRRQMLSQMPQFLTRD